MHTFFDIFRNQVLGSMSCYNMKATTHFPVSYRYSCQFRNSYGGSYPAVLYRMEYCVFSEQNFFSSTAENKGSPPFNLTTALPFKAFSTVFRLSVPVFRSDVRHVCLRRFFGGICCKIKQSGID